MISGADIVKATLVYFVHYVFKGENSKFVFVAELRRFRPKIHGILWSPKYDRKISIRCTSSEDEVLSTQQDTREFLCPL